MHHLTHLLKNTAAGVAVLFISMVFFSISANAAYSLDGTETDPEQDYDWIVTKEATCTEDGERMRYENGSVITDVIPAGHKFVEHTVEPTCIEDGEEVKECTVCGYTITNTLPAYGHSYYDYGFMKEPTHTEPGYYYYTCTRCGHNKVKEEIPPTGHLFYPIESKEATCTEDGFEKSECEICGLIRNEVIPAYGEHKYVFYGAEDPPTCTEPGYYYYTCERCGHHKVKEVIPPAGHNDFPTENYKEPTCTEDGFQESYCGTCDTTFRKVLPALGHIPHDEEMIEIFPTCTSEGMCDITCERCGQTIPGSERTLPVISHPFSPWRITTEPTEDHEGAEERFCAVCGAKEKRTLPKLHTEANNTSVESEEQPEKPQEEKPAIDPVNQTGADGTALGEGASAAAAHAAISSMINDDDLPGAAFSRLQLKSTKQTRTSITLKWKKVAGAEKYVIYGNRCGNGKVPKKIATSTGKSRKITKAAGKKLKKGKYYKFMIVALDENNNVVSSSKIIHVATKGGKVGNDKKVTTKAKKNKVSLRKGKTFKLGARTKAAEKKLKVKKHRKISYESTNTKVATVSKSGKIKGKKKGTCYVYAYAQNGVFARIKVTVK